MSGTMPKYCGNCAYFNSEGYVINGVTVSVCCKASKSAKKVVSLCKKFDGKEALK